MKNVFLFVLFSIISGFIFGQKKSIDRSNQQWFQYYNQYKLNSKLILLTDVGYRFISNFKYRSKYLVRLGFGYQLTPDLRVAMKIAHLGGYKLGELNIQEFRSSQELLLKTKIPYGFLTQNFRVEERFFKPINNGNVTKFNFRFRYQLMCSFSLLNFFHEQKKLLLSVGDEIFINSGKDIIYNVFDQNRILIGPTIVLGPTLSFQFIYNHQFKAKNTPQEYRQDYVYWLKIKHKIGFSK